MRTEISSTQLFYRLVKKEYDGFEVLEDVLGKSLGSELSDRDLWIVRIEVFPSAQEKLAALLEERGRELAGELGAPDLDESEMESLRSEVVGGRTRQRSAFAQYHLTSAYWYRNKAKGRFNDERRGAWYCSDELETSRREVQHYLELERSKVKLSGNGRIKTVNKNAKSIYVVIVSGVVPGEYEDLGCQPGHPALRPKSEMGHKAGQQLARSLLREEKMRGLLYPSARRADGQCFVAFTPSIVTNVEMAGYCAFDWNMREWVKWYG